MRWSWQKRRKTSVLAYSYAPDPGLKDYGHSFPVKRLKQFTRKNANVSGRIRAALRARSRFGSRDVCAKEIESIIALDDDAVCSSQSFTDHVSDTVQDSCSVAFDEHKFSTHPFFVSLQKKPRHRRQGLRNQPLPTIFLTPSTPPPPRCEWRHRYTPTRHNPRSAAP